MIRATSAATPVAAPNAAPRVAKPVAVTAPTTHTKPSRRAAADPLENVGHGVYQFVNDPRAGDCEG